MNPKLKDKLNELADNGLLQITIFARGSVVLILLASNCGDTNFQHTADIRHSSGNVGRGRLANPVSTAVLGVNAEHLAQDWRRLCQNLTTRRRPSSL
jgi:hypothetical protein